MIKKAFLLLGIIALLASCSSYYYSKLSTNDIPDTKNEYGNFVSGNDSIQIVYSFYGENAPVTIMVINQTNQPLYVDWQKSALIINNYAVNYQGDQIKIDGNVQASTFNYSRYWSDSSGTFDGMATLPKGVSFIPPHSQIEHTPLRLDNFAFDTIPSKRYQTTKFAKSNRDVVDVKTITFSESDSPLCLRSYLTLYTPDGDKNKPLTFQQSFYMSTLIKTGDISPSNFADNKHGDFFYVKKVQGENTGSFLGIIAISTAGILLYNN